MPEYHWSWSLIYTPVNQRSHQRTVQPAVMKYQGYHKDCSRTSDHNIKVMCNGTHSVFYRFHAFLVIPQKGKMARISLLSLLSKNSHTMTITTIQIEICVQKCCIFFNPTYVFNLPEHNKNLQWCTGAGLQWLMSVVFVQFLNSTSVNSC